MGITLNEDKLAIDVYQHSQATGQPVTLGTVECVVSMSFAATIRAVAAGCARQRSG